jgi:hypothetical protein
LGKRFWGEVGKRYAEMARDIDYAATAVKTAILEKFGRHNVLDELDVVPNDTTITVQHGLRTAEGTRDDLLAGIRKAVDYDGLWQEWDPASK